MPDDDVTLTVNGREITAPKGQLVINAAEQHGVFIPRFCYHPRMEPVGMCRMCIVDIDTGRGPALQPACMIQVAPDMKVDTESEATKKAQDGVLEFLLINHPLDCPVCDKGGECPLQDNAYAYGPGESRFVEEKRHFEKPIPVSDLVFLDRERCILCDRCTRFADQVAGDPLIAFINRGSQTEVNTFPDDPFASYFSGNTVQICPVGALTAKPFRFKARPWDLEKVESTCTSCAVGCRVTIEASRNHVLRYQGVDIDPVNWGWLCDKGRFDFEAIESDDRLADPMVRKPARSTDGSGELVPATWSEALASAADAISKADPNAVAVLGGSRLTNEAAYAWAKFAKGVVGTDHVDAQLDDGLPGDVVSAWPQATIDDACAEGATVVVIDVNVKEELPVLFLRLRDAVQNRGVKLIEISPIDTGLTPLASVSLRHFPGEAHKVTRALATRGDATAVHGGDIDAARTLVSGPVVVIVGRSSLGESASSVVESAAILLELRPGTTILPALRRANVRGAIDMGLVPGLLPGRVTLDAGREWFTNHWPNLPAQTGLDATGILTAAAEGRIDVLVLLGADPLSDFRDRGLAQRALAGARMVVAVDTFLNPSTEKADVVLAAAGYAETEGTTTNLEGRVSVLGRKVTPPGTARADWMIAAELAYRMGHDLELESADGIWQEIEEVAPAHAGITRDLLRSTAGTDGVLVPLRPEVARAAEGRPVHITGVDGTMPDSRALAATAETTDAADTETADAADTEVEPTDDAVEPAESAEETAVAEATGPARPDLISFARGDRYESPGVDAYSLRLLTHRRLYDLGTLVQHSPSLAALAPGGELLVHPYDLDRLGILDGGRIKILSPSGSLTVDAHASTAIPKGAAALAVNQPGPNPTELIDATQDVTDIRVETV